MRAAGGDYVRCIGTTVVWLILSSGIATCQIIDGTHVANDHSRGTLTLTSPAFSDGGIIPDRYTQAAPGTPVSPPLQWTNAPQGVASYALILRDPDTSLAKTTREIVHWMIVNIPSGSAGLAEGVPQRSLLSDGSIQLLNHAGTIGYIGMRAPAAGPFHHYTFELFALDIKLALGPKASESDLRRALDGHVLKKAVLVGRFHM